MTRRHAAWGAVLAAAALCGAAGGGGTGPAGGPEALGAHWARVSPHTQAELLADGMRSAAGGGAAAVMMSAIARRTGAAAAPAPGGAAASADAPRSTSLDGGSGGFSAGATFIPTPISSELGIDRLTKTWTENRLGRALFSTPGPTASYYTAHYTQGPPYVSATYVQFVVDPAWNRIVYGNMNAWIKSYDDIIGPTSIAVDPSGRVYVGEAGRERVDVLQLQGEGQSAQLRPLFTLDGVTAPAAVAVNDNGTPLDPSDDCLYVADAARGAILKYTLGSAGGTLAATYGGFDSPSALAVGRWNGANDGFLYVVDRVARRVRVFQESGTSLAPVAEYTGGYQSYYSSIGVDHFGNIYLADNVQSTLLKMTAALEPLDEEGGVNTYAALASVSVPFGMITVDGQGTYWAGFDQLFAVEQWTNGSGAQRRTLGLGVKNIRFTTDENGSAIHAGFTMTDFGSLGVRITDASGAPVRTIPATAMVSGVKDIVWDRRDDAGRLVAPGTYRCTLGATDPYRQETVSASAEWTLPLYYDEEGGTDEPQLTRGTPLHWGENSASTDPQAVQYRFTGLDPSGSYAVSASYIAPPDGLPRTQALSAGSGLSLGPPAPVGQTMTTTGFLPVPAAAYAHGELLLSVIRLDQGPAVISRLLLKETGRGFSSTEEATPQIPAAYALAQNYPNPFNPSTVLSYDMPADGRVSIVVYDILGRSVETLVDGLQTAGTHSVTWNAAGMASGVYFVRMRANEKMIGTRKLILLK